MQLTQIDSDKKYVLVLPEAREEFVLKLIEEIEEFRTNDRSILIVFGTDATIVSIDQIDGYTTL